MSANYGWTQDQDRELFLLVKTGNFLNKEIAEKLGRSPYSISYRLRKFGIKNTASSKVYGKWNKKYSDEFRKKVIAYFRNHNARETAEKFKISHGQTIGILETSRRSGLLPPKFKDQRNKKPWTASDYQFLLAHAGLMPRDWIAKKLNRGGLLGIKDRLELLGVSSKSLNGITLSQFREAFGTEPDFYLQTKAGPGRGGTPTYYKIIPWVWLDGEIRARRLHAPEPMRKLVRSMALFQDWVHDGDALKKMKRICR
jgi:transposase